MNIYIYIIYTNVLHELYVYIKNKSNIDTCVYVMLYVYIDMGKQSYTITITNSSINM